MTVGWFFIRPDPEVYNETGSATLIKRDEFSQLDTDPICARRIIGQTEQNPDRTAGMRIRNFFPRIRFRLS